MTGTHEFMRSMVAFNSVTDGAPYNFSNHSFVTVGFVLKIEESQDDITVLGMQNAERS